MQAGVQIKTERCNFHALEEVKLRATSLIVVTPVGLLAVPPYHGDMDMPTDALTWSQITASAFTVGTVLAEIGFILAYLFAVRRLRARGGQWARNRVICALLASLGLVVAINSVIGVYDMSLFWVHMIQHLLLVMVVAPLLAFAAPVALFRASLKSEGQARFDALAKHPAARLLGHPVFAFLSYAIVIPVFHLTSLFNSCLTSMGVHRAEQAIFLVTGYLFWRQVAGIEPTKALSPPIRFAFTLLAIPVDTFTGLALVMTKQEPFSAYASMPRHWGPSLIDDIHLGGAIMWVGGDLLMLFVLIPVAIAWLRYEDRKTKEIDAQLDAEREALKGN
jgi:putative copper resistance protein D